MKQDNITLMIFIDAFGWEILQRHTDFLSDLIVDKKPLKSILGYSSACDPSIISGLKPSEHGMWSSFYYSPQTSPFKVLKWLDFLPSKIKNSARVRGKLSSFLAKIYGFTGYFQIYNVPFNRLALFDYAEKKWFWGTRKGLAHGSTIFESLLDQKIPFYVKSSQQITEEEQWQTVEKLIEKREIAFAYVLMGKLDAVMHQHGTQHPSVKTTLNHYEKKIRHLVQKAESTYQEVNWYIFTDHGMHDVIASYDLQAGIEKLNLDYGKDYVAMYDSTMARFWFPNPSAKEKVEELLRSLDYGKILCEEKLKEEGVYFPNHQYGETIFLMNSGLLIIPSYMGRRQLPGMHGYDPDDADSYAMICSNRQLPEKLKNIADIYELMKEETTKS